MEAPQLRFQASSSLEHDHIACKGDSACSWQWSQVELVIIVRRNRFSSVGRELRHALHMWFLTLLGVCKDHNPFHSWVSWDDGVLCTWYKVRYPDRYTVHLELEANRVCLLLQQEIWGCSWWYRPLGEQRVHPTSHCSIVLCLSIQQNINNRWEDHGWMFNRQPPVTPYLNGFSITNTPPCSP